MTAGVDQLDPFTGNPYRPLGFAFPYCLRQLSARAGAQARTAPGKRAEGHRHRRLAAGGPGAQPALQPAHRLRAGAPGQGGAGSGPREPGLLRPRAGGEPRPFPGRRHRPRGPGPPASCSAFSTNPTFQTAQVGVRTAKIQLLMLLERPHAGGAVRRHRPVRFQRAAHRPRGVRARPPWQPGRTCWRPCRRWTRPAPITTWRWPTAPPIRPSAWISRAIRPSRCTWGSASTSRCASSTATRARKPAPSSTSSAANGCGRPPRRRSTATWIRPGPR